MIKIALVEDEEQHRLLLQRYLNQYSKETGTALQIDTFGNGLSFLEKYGEGYDIVFMDIAMPHMDGLETARKLRAIDGKVILIFVTSLAKYALKGYEVDAMDFLVKPIDYFHFYLRMDKAVRLSQTKEKVSLLLTTADGKVRVVLDDVEYVESQLHYLVYHTKKGNFRVRGSLRDLPETLQKLPFVRSANSFLVNLSFIEKVSGDDLVLTGGVTLPISRSRKKEFLEALTIFYGEKR